MFVATRDVEVVSWEPAIGHVLAASGVVGIAHAALRLDERGPGGDVLALTVGFGGQNGATLVRSSSYDARPDLRFR